MKNDNRRDLTVGKNVYDHGIYPEARCERTGGEAE